MRQVHGELSFHLATPEVELHLTRRGGHLAPVTFHLPGLDVSPYSLSPWRPEEFPELPPLLSVLRGDFFCLPFGPQENGPPHGAPANGEWLEVTRDDRSLRLVMDAADSGARIWKTVSTRPGHHAIYQEHRISGLSGDFSYGTHPILDFSGLAGETGRISVSPFRWASTYPGVFSNPAAGERQRLAEGAAFGDLRNVPLAAGGTADLTRYPSDQGSDDLVMMTHVPATPEQPFAWTAAVLDGSVWFSLKNPADFPSTLLWMSNGGRSAPPWDGGHIGRIGIEDVCSHFSDGVEKSRQNLLEQLGVKTCRRFDPGETVSLRTIQAVTRVPAKFGAVSSIRPVDEHSVRITGGSGSEVIAAIDWNFALPSTLPPAISG